LLVQSITNSFWL